MSLPDKYSHFVTAWESVKPSKQNLEDLVAHLLHSRGREVKIKNQGRRCGFGGKVKEKNSNMKKTGVIKCFKCGCPGHIMIKICENALNVVRVDILSFSANGGINMKIHLLRLEASQCKLC
ncbi:hypothetical protein PR048_026538 [Dryococelus australis]|uniref:Uncharacterized protein n=1 Tax=Dryococelus australis TaxID=614101 RepID=A0ABQ9GLP2_9NEOP|nr:hypothetical protein PR048_026538 [Dryococelus australis]